MTNNTNKLSEITVRPLSTEDHLAFRTLRLRALQEEPRSFGASYEESLHLSEEEFKARLALNGERFVLGAFAGDKDSLIGMIGFYRHSGMKVKHKGTIWGMYVATEARGLGLGRLLMEAAIARASVMHGLDFINLSVVTSNESAYKLYDSCGFASYGMEKAALRIDGEDIDEYLMSLHIVRQSEV